jgi:HEAT repeat protein
MDPFAANGVQISEVQFGETDPATGAVQLGFLASRQFHLQGQVSDPRIQQLLAYALVNAKNPGVRLRAVSAIETASSRLPRGEIQNALIAALKTDPNVAVREKALLSLRQYPLNPAIQEALIQVLLYDENAKLRIEAISSLEIAVAEMPVVDPDLRDALENRVESDKNRYIRLRARAVLQEVSQQ